VPSIGTGAAPAVGAAPASPAITVTAPASTASRLNNVVISPPTAGLVGVPLTIVRQPARTVQQDYSHYSRGKVLIK
jgi:hypothetical protein